MCQAKNDFLSRLNILKLKRNKEENIYEKVAISEQIIAESLKYGSIKDQYIAYMFAVVDCSAVSNVSNFIEKNTTLDNTKTSFEIWDKYIEKLLSYAQKVIHITKKNPTLEIKFNDPTTNAREQAYLSLGNAYMVRAIRLLYSRDLPKSLQCYHKAAEAFNFNDSQLLKESHARATAGTTVALIMSFNFFEASKCLIEFEKEYKLLPKNEQLFFYLAKSIISLANKDTKDAIKNLEKVIDDGVTDDPFFKSQIFYLYNKLKGEMSPEISTVNGGLIDLYTATSCGKLRCCNQDS